MLGQLLDFLIGGVIGIINIEYFIFVLLFSELVKSITLYSNTTKKHTFKFDKKARFPFRFRFLAVVLGIICAIFIYFFSVPFGIFDPELIKQLVVTFAMTTSFYELFFFIVIDKFKEVLKRIGKAEVKPIVIDLSLNTGHFGGGYTDYNDDYAHEDKKYKDKKYKGKPLPPEEDFSIIEDNEAY